MGFTLERVDKYFLFLIALLVFFFKQMFTITMLLPLFFFCHTNRAAEALITISRQLVVKEKILNGPSMLAGEVNHKYLSQQPSILTSELCVVSVSFNFRAVSVRPFLNAPRTYYFY